MEKIGLNYYFGRGAVVHNVKNSYRLFGTVCPIARKCNFPIDNPSK